MSPALAGRFITTEPPGTPLFLVFWANRHTIFHSGCTSLHSPQQHTRVSFSLRSHWYLLPIDFLMVAIQWGDILLWFCFLFPWMISNVEHLFRCLLTISMSSLQNCLLMSSAHFLIRFFLHWVGWPVDIFCILNSYWSYHLQIFSPIQ